MTQWNTAMSREKEKRRTIINIFTALCQQDQCQVTVSFIREHAKSNICWKATAASFSCKYPTFIFVKLFLSTEKRCHHNSMRQAGTCGRGYRGKHYCAYSVGPNNQEVNRKSVPNPVLNTQERGPVCNSKTTGVATPFPCQHITFTFRNYVLGGLKPHVVLDVIVQVAFTIKKNQMLWHKTDEIFSPFWPGP